MINKTRLVSGMNVYLTPDQDAAVKAAQASLPIAKASLLPRTIAAYLGQFPSDAEVDAAIARATDELAGVKVGA
jgi:hypothetical protein